MKTLYLDFEFTNINEQDFKLVCACSVLYDGGVLLEKRSFWFYNGEDTKLAQNYFHDLMDEGVTFVAYVMEAEARALFTLFGTANIDINAIDLYLEYRCLTNHWEDYAYGQQLINGKVVKTTPPPLYTEIDEEDDEKHHKPQHSLAACTFKLLNKIIDTEEKKDVRDIIILERDIELHRQRILDYCMSDILNLRDIFRAIGMAHLKSGFAFDEFIGAARCRGSYSVYAARMSRLGYPVNMEKIRRFSTSVTEILNESAKDVIAASETPLFRKNLKTGLYSMHIASIRELILTTPYADKWLRTDKDQLSYSRKAFDKFYSKETPGAIGAFIRYLSLKQSLNGFLPSKGAKTKKFFDFVGTDDRVRYFQGIYGSQSSRSQPGASGFIPLKAHWMRNFIEAPKGRAIAGIDYASQEFLLAAVLAQDNAMIAAYASGDIYLAFAKLARLCPPDATKTSHKAVRDACKALVLGMSYDMGKDGLAARMTADSGKVYTSEDAEKFIEMFFETYPDYAEWKRDNLRTYREEGRLQLPDGWVMWGDNPNFRSVGNFPVQGLGAVIMREAVKLAFARGLDVIFTLHDALYIEYDSGDFSAIKTLIDCMAEAFTAQASKFGRFIPIRLEGETWSRDYTSDTDSGIPGVHCMSEYIDERGRRDYLRFKKYFV